MAAQGAITQDALGTFAERVDTRTGKPDRQTEETNPHGAKHLRSAAETTSEPPQREMRPILGWQTSVRGVTRLERGQGHSPAGKERRTRVHTPESWVPDQHPRTVPWAE